MSSKNHTISKIVAKTSLRVLIILLGFAVFILFDQSDNAIQRLHFQSYWSLVAPIVLFFTVIVLMIITLKYKYSKTDINWLFSLSAVFLSVYLVLLYSRIYPLL